MSRTLRTTWPTFRTRIAIALNDTALGQARIAPTPDDHVIVHAEIEQVGTLHELPREANVLAAGRGIAAGVIVEQHDGGGGLEDRRLEDLARVHEARRQRALRHDHVPQETVLGAQE